MILGFDFGLSKNRFWSLEIAAQAVWLSRSCVNAAIMFRFVLVLILALVIGCDNAPTSSDHNHAGARSRELKPFTGKHPIRVVCTTSMLGDLVRNIGGEHLQVETLMGAGVDPHLYQPSPHDVSRLHNADLIIYSGLHLEGKMTEVFARLASRKPTIAVAELVHEKPLGKQRIEPADPHIWFDVELWMEAAEVVAQTLQRFDPAHQADYEAALDRYRKQLRELDEYVRTQSQLVPQDQRVLVTAHDAFRYFGHAYGWEVKGVQGISTDSEAGVKQVNELVAFLVRSKIKAVFIETSVSDQNVRSLREGCEANGHELKLGGELYSDALGSEDTAAGTYVGMVRHNIDTIVAALK
jgi:manganese/zinc/iron transport system substrate-binding protein